MIRLVLLLILLAAIAFGAAWLVDQPGSVAVIWGGQEYLTTVPVALAVVAVIAGIALLVWKLISFLLRSPAIVAAMSHRRRRDKGWQAVSTGLVAIGTGDAAAVRRAHADAVRHLPHEPLTRLLAAQAAQFSGDHDGAVHAFRNMAEHEETRLLGLRGLYIEARRAGDTRAAYALAEEAASVAPRLGWAAEAVMAARCGAGDYAGARAVLEKQMAQRGIDKAAYRRQKAVLLAAEALALEHSDPLVAKEKALEAVRLAPTLVPAAACAGRLLGAAGELKKAARIVETAFAANPHPDLADVEAHLRPGDAALDRLRRIRTLANTASGDRESAIALAHAAIDAHEFRQARTVLEPLLEEPTQRVCLLMAELEAAEHADIGKAREWTARAVRAGRDPAWIADGIVSDHWEPVSPVTGKLDAFVWAVPPGVSATPILEHEAERVKLAIAAVHEAEAAKVAEIEAAAREAAAAEAAAAEAAAREAAAAAAAEPPVPAEPVVEVLAPVPAEPALEEAKPAAAAPAEPAATARPAPAAPAPANDRSRSTRHEPEPIIAQPPLPDDPGPDPDTPAPEPRRRFLGI